MMRQRRIRIIFTVLSIMFVFDAIFLTYFVPWDKIFGNGNKVKLKHYNYKKASQITDDQSVTELRDIRSMSNFHNDLPFVPSRIKSHAEKPSIPHIIHQTWDTEHVPKIFHKWIVTWLRDNPGWEYWFWSLGEVRKFVIKEYPEFMRVYDIYTADIFRSDAMRYLVLYKYGGIYLDMDMESLKPLDNWTYGFQCIVSEETYAHPFVVREDDPPANIVNGFLASRPGHPFLKLAVDSLEEYAGLYLGDYLHATGPLFLNAVLQRYMSQNITKGDRHNEVTIIHPKYFVPTYDPSESDIISDRCFPDKYQNLAAPGQQTCKELHKIFMRRVPLQESYADHHWVHAYMFDEGWKKKETKHINDIVPNALIRHKTLERKKKDV